MEKDNRSRPRLKDISERAGISIMAVSRILRGTGRESPATCERVRAEAARLGYRPNGLARAMRRGSFGAVGLLRSTNPSAATITHTFLWAIERELLACDLQLVMGQVPDRKLTDSEAAPRLLREWSVDGLLVNYTSHIPEKMIAVQSQFHLPAVWLNTRRKHNCVYPDDCRAMREATAKLLALGHRKIAYLGVPLQMEHYSIQDRHEGYQKAMEAAGATPRVVLWGEHDDRLTDLCAILRKPDRPTALVTYSACEAMVAVVAAARLGLEMPRDLSLIAIRDDLEPMGGVDVTTMLIPDIDMASLAVNMLRRRIAKPEIEEPSIGVTFIEHEGATCAPPAKTARKPASA